MMSLVLNMKLRKLQIHLAIFPVQILLSFILHLLELLMLLITLANPLPPCLSPKLHRSPANSTPSNVDNDVIARVMQNFTKNTHFCHNEIKKSDASPSKIRLDKSDVIMLDKENYYAPDSISPSPKPGMTRFFSKQAASDKDNASPPLSQRRGCSQSFKSPLHLLGIKRFS